MQSGKQRARAHDEGAARNLPDSARDAKAVAFARYERFQDEQIEGALEDVCAFGLQDGAPIGFR